MLTIEGLWKTYEPASGLARLLVRTALAHPVDALRGIDVEVAPGKILGLVGPNAAGKSTLIRVCSTLLDSTRGRVLIDGVDVARQPTVVRGQLGLLLADERALYWRLTGRENLRFFGVMAGLSADDARRRGDELLERYGLAADDRRVFGYSSGMRVKLGLARAMLSRPQLLILDEPTRSLDPLASDELLSDLVGLAGEGTTVVLSSHRLDEVERICDHVLVLIGGRQVASCPMEELRAAGGSGQAVRALLDEATVPKADS